MLLIVLVLYSEPQRKQVVPENNEPDQMWLRLFLQICKTKKGNGYVPLLNTMHTGQIILLTKMIANADLGFYEFTDAKPTLKWKSETAKS